MPKPSFSVQSSVCFAGRAVLISLCLAARTQAQAGPPASAPATSQPALPKFVTMSFEEMLKEVSQRPLVRVELKTSTGQPLTADEKSKLQQADTLLTTASAARKKGEYKAAADSVREALSRYQSLFGSSHFLTITAVTESATLDQISRLSPAEQQDLIAADRAEETAEAATKQGDFFAVRKNARQALDIRERILGKSHAELGNVLRLAGNAEIELQSLNSAKDLLTRALDITEVGYGKNHPKTAGVLDRAGWLRIYEGKYDAAAVLLRRAVWIFTNTRGEGAETAESLDNLGTALAYNGEFDEAMHVKLRALFVRETLLGPSARDTGVSLSNLAWLFGRVGKFDQVIPLRNRALAIFEKELGVGHHDTVVELSNLAQAYFGEGKYKEAADLYEKQITRDEQAAAALDAGAVNRLMMLGSVYLKSGRSDEGRRALSRAAEKAKRLYDGGERSAAINELSRVAVVYEGYRMWDDAASTREQIWKWDESQSAIANAETIQRNVQTARDFIAVGRLKEAASILTKAVSQATVLFGEGELETVNPIIALATARERLGELEPSVKLCEKALQVIEAKEIKDSQIGMMVMYQLGRSQSLQKKYDLARFTLEDALDRLKKSPRPQPLLEISFLRELAVCHAALGEKEEATRQFDKVLTQSREWAKDGNLHRLSDLAASLNRYLEAADLGLAIDAKRKEALVTELRSVLDKLRTANALTAENKKWLQEPPSSHP